MEPGKELAHQALTSGSDKDGIILCEDSLRKLSKSLNQIIPKDGHKIDDAGLRHLQSLHNDLLKTAGSAKLSLTHGAAAIGSLCGFLEQCSESAKPEANVLPFAFHCWTKALRVFLTRTENNKAKPMRRLLMTLTRLILKHPAEDVKLSLIAHAIYVATRAIQGQDEVSSIKAAIQVLEHFLSVRVVDALEIIQKVTTTQLNPRRPRSPAQNLDPAEFVDTVQIFTSSMLQWVQYPDCAPAVGRFLPAFFASLSGLQCQRIAHGSADGLLPLWISPIKQSLQRRQGLLEVYENHVLPGLLRLGAADRKTFLSTLPLDEIIQGNGGKHTVTDIQLCILVAKIESGTKLEPTPRDVIQKTKSTNEVEQLQVGIETLYAEKERIDIDVKRLGMNLLEHSSPVVRISAFALLASSPITTRPLSAETLSYLQRCIPFFHIEVGAKARNEYITSMKKLYVKLRGTTLSFIRDRQGSVSAYLDQTVGLPPADRLRGEQKGHDLPRDLGRQLSFRQWYIRFLVHELRPTASYQSHITALRILHSFLEETRTLLANPSIANEQYIKLSNEESSLNTPLRPLLDLLLDPFDDVRQVANSVIKTQISLRQMPPLPKPNGEADIEAQSFVKDEDVCNIEGVIRAALNKAESRAAGTGRADHADGVGRLYDLHYGFDSALSILDQLLSKLEEEVDFAKKNLLVTINNAPLHGHLIALRHLTNRPNYWFLLNASTPHGRDIWTHHNERIMALCSGVWEAVREILCFDAPEGTIVTEEEADNGEIGTKDTLSYCWRALKESSSLMHSMITNQGYSPSPYDICINLERFGQLSLKQLGELRHRGAFSTVSLTFAACCTACVQSCNPVLIQEQKSWYKEALACMVLNASALTRRSAGLPAMITGILAPHPNGDFFNDVVLDLQAIADGPLINNLDSEDAPLPQVHALNCLKDIFTDARFGTSTEAHMANTMGIAASCLESHIWAIRNCGLMLFKALLRRLNHGTDTASTKVSSSYRRSSNIAYEKCPNLPGLLVNLFASRSHTTLSHSSLDGNASTPTMRNQSLFAALEVIERAGIPPGHEAEILGLLWDYAECPEWSLREKAAKALSLMVDDYSVEGEVRRLLSPDWKSQNALHGRLLCLRFIFGRAQAPLFGSSLGAYERLLPLLDGHLDDLVVENSCPVTAAAFLDCMTELMVVLIKSRIKSYSQHDQDGVVGTLHQLPQRHLEALVAMDEMQQYDSDENILATLSHTSSHELQYASGAKKLTNWIPIEQPRLPRNPREADFLLALLGYRIGAAYTGYPGEFSHQPPLTLWIRMLQLAGSEHSELQTRSAAAFSLRGFFEALLHNKIKPEPGPDLLEVYLALYGTLLDDDEDVRDQAATTVSLLLSAVEFGPSSDTASSFSLSPPAAKSRLLNFMEEGYRTSTSMYMRAAEILVGLQLLPGTHSIGDDKTNWIRETKLRPVADISQEAQMPQLAVFVEEKQNLYIDTAKEANDWAQILIGLDSDACVVEVAEALEKWSIDGLLHFLNTLRQNGDSAFGPTSIPEVFTLFMRVILSAKVVLARSVPAAGQEDVEESPCRRLLEELLMFGREKKLHSLLIDSVKKILGKA